MNPKIIYGPSFCPEAIILGSVKPLDHVVVVNTV